MPDTSQGQLALVKETVPGAVPATPAFKVIDIVDEDLMLGVTNVRSAAVTKQRVVKSSRRAGREVGGGFRIELSKGEEVDAIIQGLMGNPFAGTPPTAKAGGIIADSFTLERKISPTDYRRFSGFRMGSAEFTIAPEQHIMCRVTGMGYAMTTGAAPIAGATYTDPLPANSKLTALDVLAITLSGGLTSSVDFETLSFTINNQPATRKRIGPNSVRKIGVGQALVTGSARVYIDNGVIADAFNSDTHFNMDVPMLLGTSGYTALLKNVAITSYNDPTTGNNDEFMGAIEFEATLDAAFGSSFGFASST